VQKPSKVGQSSMQINFIIGEITLILDLSLEFHLRISQNLLLAQVRPMGFSPNKAGRQDFDRIH
jgi:hypothetical protein